MNLREESMRLTLKFILRLIHYWFPVAVGWSTTMVIQKASGLPILPSGFHLYLLMIWAAYSLDRLLDLSAQEKQPFWFVASLWAALCVSAALGAILVVQLPAATIALIALFTLITLLYRKLKQIPFLKTILVAIVWTWAGVALPFQNQNWFAWQFWTMSISLPLVILFAISVILCDFKDMRSDRKQGVYSLPVVFGLRNTMWAVSALLLITAAIAYTQQRMGLVISSAALFSLAQFPIVLSLDAIGPLLVDASLALPGLLILLHVV